MTHMLDTILVIMLSTHLAYAALAMVIARIFNFEAYALNIRFLDIHTETEVHKQKVTHCLTLAAWLVFFYKTRYEKQHRPFHQFVSIKRLNVISVLTRAPLCVGWVWLLYNKYSLDITIPVALIAVAFYVYQCMDVASKTKRIEEQCLCDNPINHIYHTKQSID